MSEAVTMPNCIMMTSIVSEESLARDTHTHRDIHSDTYRHTHTHTHTHTHRDCDSGVLYVKPRLRKTLETKTRVFYSLSLF